VSAAPEVDSTPTPAAPRAIDCTQLPVAEAEALLAEANALIDEAGEHPDQDAVVRILEKLRKAAYGGLPAAQLRYGWFVVGYYATDEMFWPGDRDTAVGALGLLRFAVMRDPTSAEDFPGLDQTPPDPNSAFIQLLDPEWLRLAVEEASAYEACVDKQGAAAADAGDVDACPQRRGEVSQNSPSQIVDDVAEVYEACVVDYLEVYGEAEQQVVALSPAERRRALCAALGSEGDSVFERAQSGKKFQTRAPETCVGAQKQELRMGRFIWEFSKLPNSRYLVTRTARTGSPWGLLYHGHSIDTLLDGHFVVTVVTSDGWRCPRDPEDPCDSFGDENAGTAQQVRCISDQTTPCSEAGVTSDVYVTDTATRATVHFGSFDRRPRPTIKISTQQVEVSAGDCSQTIGLPLVAAKPG